MNKTTFNHLVRDFESLLGRSHFCKQDFLFNSSMYVDGFRTIISKSLALYAQQNMGKKPRVLDIGCGSGFTSYLLARAGCVVSALDIYDTSQDIQNVFKRRGASAQQVLWNALQDAIGGKNLSLGFYNGTHLPFRGEEFDMVFAHAVLEHVPVEVLDLLMGDLVRVLQSGGLFVVGRTPNKYALTECLSRSHDRMFTKGELLLLLRQFGLDPMYYTKTDFFPEHAPPAYQRALNALTPVLGLLDRLICHTPVRIFSHHHFVVARKSREVVP